MSKTIKKIAPLALGLAVPGIGTALGLGAMGTAALGAGAGALGSKISGGNMLKGAIGGGLGGYLGGGGLGTAPSSINWTTAAPGYATGVQNYAGTGLLGGLGKFGSVGNAIGRGISGAASGGGGVGGGIGNIASNIFSGVQGTGAYKDMERQQLAANKQALSAVSPFAATGQSANTRLAALLGLDPNADQESILEQLRNTPGYDFRMQQGQQALDRSQAARGGFFSGEALKASQALGQGLADQTYNDYVSRLAQQSGQGLGAAGGMANLYGQAGDIRANSTLGRSNLLNRSLANVFGQPYEDMLNG